MGGNTGSTNKKYPKEVNTNSGNDNSQIIKKMISTSQKISFSISTNKDFFEQMLPVDRKTGFSYENW